MNIHEHQAKSLLKDYGVPVPTGYAVFSVEEAVEAAGKIADGYPGIGAGYDAMVIAGLGLNTDAVRAHITNDKPTYPQFEAWIQAQEGATLGADAIGALNDSIVGYNHDDETRQGILNANGLPDGNPQDAVNLNNLDDWLEFHAAEIA